ncbi:4-hydroxy-tetrahydrodipicolinate reductase [Leptospira interrogans]
MSEPIDVCVAGASGGVGQQLIAEILRRPEQFRLVSAVTRKTAGEDIGSVVVGRACGVIATDSIEKALDAKPSVLIDYTHPSAVRDNIAAAFARGIHVVIGTTGFFDDDFDRIDEAAKHAGVGAITGNFSLTAALMLHFSKIAARYVPHWEVIEYAGAHKPDVPSGTAREVAEELGRVRSPHVQLQGDQLIGPVEARGAKVGGAHVHSVRLPGCPLAVEVIFGLKGERLILRHDEQDNTIFVEGSLLAAREVRSIKGLVRGLDTLLIK